MCNACGFLCCAYDGFSKCGCDHCPVEACWDLCDFCGENGCGGECRADDYDGPDDFVPEVAAAVPAPPPRFARSPSPYRGGMA